jgi:hypothetical protein
MCKAFRFNPFSLETNIIGLLPVSTLESKSMVTDIDYELLPARLRSMTEAQLVVEERTASEALTQYVLEHPGETNCDTPESLAVELRFIEAQLALNLKVRDNTIRTQLATERARGELTTEGEKLVRELARGTFAKGIDRLESQLRRAREKLEGLSQ